MGLFDGWNYHFRPHAATNEQRSAQRASLEQFQTTPANRVQGAGTLTGHSAWMITQPPQIVAHHVGVTNSIIAGGTRTIGLYTSPLVENRYASTGF